MTAADTALARSALLVRVDFGSGWSSKPAPSKVPPMTCNGFKPALNGVVETGAAASRTFYQTGTREPDVSSVAYVYRTAGQEAEVWHRVVTQKLLTCVGEALAGGSTRGLKFTVDRQHMLPLPSLAAGTRGYRVIGTATSSYQQFGVYLDLIVLERGRTLAAVTYANSLVPAPRSLELRLARKVAARLVN